LSVAIKNPLDPQNHDEHDEHDKHGSGEPAREHNNIILQAIYNVYNGILQVHGMYAIYFSFLYFAFLLNPLDLLAMKTRKKNVPKSPAEMTRQKNPLWQLAGFMNPPSLLRIPRQDPARHPPLPPPATPHNGGGGRGQETNPARPCILNRYFYFHFPHMNDYIFLYDTTYSYSIQSGLMNEV
jgi:hypothetical protein